MHACVALPELGTDQTNQRVGIPPPYPPKPLPPSPPPRPTLGPRSPLIPSGIFHNQVITGLMHVAGWWLHQHRQEQSERV